MVDSNQSKVSTKADETRHHLSSIALFLGEIRDGITMINMQSTYLITTKSYSEKEVGLMFFAFGISQFTFQMPVGYLIDYLHHKRMLLALSAVGTTLLTLATAVFAADDGGNLRLMLIIKFIQGAITSFIPPCLNSITQGIVGAVGMTEQVAKNEMMHHWGTAVLVMTASVLGYILYPHIETLFLVSPIACIGVIHHLRKIKARYIDHHAARGLIESPNVSIKSTTSEISYDHDLAYRIHFTPSFYCGCRSYSSEFSEHHSPRLSTQKADTPLEILKNPKLMNFLIVCFTFNLANGTILPLVMQTLAIDNGRLGILLSGCCIAVAQIFMELSAEFCGKYSGVYGRKLIFITGITTLCLRCTVLAVLLTLRDNQNFQFPLTIFNVIILSTQILDGIGAGVFGTMYVLVTSDLSIGTGRFSLTLGLTTAAVSLGGTVSGYAGQALAEDFGYLCAFISLGVISLLPVLLYVLGVPETFLSENDDESYNESLASSTCTGHGVDRSDNLGLRPDVDSSHDGSFVADRNNLGDGLKSINYKKEVKLLFQERSRSKGSTKKHVTFDKENF